MIEILKEYYDITITDFKTMENGIVFIVSGDYYYLYKTNYDLAYINHIASIYKNGKIRFHDFVLNKNKELLSDGYVLFKLNTLIDKTNLQDLNEFAVQASEKNYVSMDKIWESKIDYIEQQVVELSQNTLINNSFDYFVGLAEILISLLRNNTYEGTFFLSHKKFTNTTLSFYNPLNVTFDLRLRDFAFYIRKNNDYDLLYKVLDNNLSPYEYKYLFCRLVFPFDYFNYVEEILLDKKEETDLVNYLNKIDEYEEYIFKMQEIFGLKVFLWQKK